MSYILPVNYLSWNEISTQLMFDPMEWTKPTEKSNHNRHTISHGIVTALCLFFIYFFFLHIYISSYSNAHHVISSSHFTRDTFQHSRKNLWKSKRMCGKRHRHRPKKRKNNERERANEEDEANPQKCVQKKYWSDWNDEVINGMKQSGKRALFSHHLCGGYYLMCILFRQWCVCVSVHSFHF